MEDLFVSIFMLSLLGMFVGLIRPTIFSFIGSGGVTRKKIGLIFGSLIVISFILSVIVMEPTEDEEEVKKEVVNEEVEEIKEVSEEETKNSDKEDLTISKEDFSRYEKLFNEISSLHSEYISIKDEVRQAEILREVRKIETPVFNNNLPIGEKRLIIPIGEYHAFVSYLRYRNGKFEGADLANEKKKEMEKVLNLVKEYNNF